MNTIKVVCFETYLLFALFVKAIILLFLHYYIDLKYELYTMHGHIYKCTMNMLKRRVEGSYTNLSLIHLSWS